MSNELTNVTEVSQADIAALSAMLGQPASERELLKESLFLSKVPQAVDLLVNLPSIDKTRSMLNFLDTATYSMAGDSMYQLPELKLTKKMDAKNPTYFIGTFKHPTDPTPLKSFKFLPLIIYQTRVFFPPRDNKKPEAGARGYVCRSTDCVNGAFMGVSANATPYVRSCDGCPYREWGVDIDGNVDRMARTRPLCRHSYNVLGLTQDFSSLMSLELNSFCTGKEFEAHKKLIINGKMMGQLNLDALNLPPEELKKYFVQHANVNIGSRWVEITGKQIDNVKGETVSAGTVVSPTNQTLTNEEVVYAMLYKSFAAEYMIYLFHHFNQSLNRILETSAADVTQSPSIEAKAVAVEEEIEYDVIDED